MKSKIVQLMPVSLALLSIVFTYFSQWCTRPGQICYRTLLDRMIPEFTYPLYFFALYFLPIAIILIFVSRPTFNFWLKFAGWGFLVALLFIATTPVYGTGLILSSSRDDVARFVGEIFMIASLILIIWKYFSTRHKQKLIK